MKKILFSLICFFFIFIKVDAVTTFERTEDNLRVNKHFNITSQNKINVLNTPSVSADEKIYDFANILTEDEKEQLKLKIDSFVSKTKMDMVILTTNFRYVNDSENETYAVDFYDYNDFGIDFEHYSGILILRNAYDLDPYFNIYTFGEAQRYFPYERCESILDDIYIDLKSHYYLNGFTKFINDATEYYNSGIPSNYRNYYVDDMGYLQKKFAVSYSWMLIFSLIFTIIVIIILIKSHKMVHKAINANVYAESKKVNLTKQNDIFLHTHTASHVISSGGGGGFGGSFSGSSGGGHGGGGGRHG